jgi:flagellar hook-length control protein FliK
MPIVAAGPAAGPAGMPGAALPGSPPAAAEGGAFDAVFQQLTGTLLSTAVVAGEAAPIATGEADGGDAEATPSSDGTLVIDTPVLPLPVVLAWVPAPPPGDAALADGEAEESISAGESAPETIEAAPVDREGAAGSTVPLYPGAAPVDRAPIADDRVWHDALTAAPVDRPSPANAPVWRDAPAASPDARRSQTFEIGAHPGDGGLTVDAAPVAWRGTHASGVPAVPPVRQDAPAIAAGPLPSTPPAPTDTNGAAPLAEPSQVGEISASPVSRHSNEITAAPVSRGSSEVTAAPVSGRPNEIAAAPVPRPRAGDTTAAAAPVAATDAAPAAAPGPGAPVVVPQAPDTANALPAAGAQAARRVATTPAGTPITDVGTPAQTPTVSTSREARSGDRDSTAANGPAVTPAPAPGAGAALIDAVSTAAAGTTPAETGAARRRGPAQTMPRPAQAVAAAAAMPTPAGRDAVVPAPAAAVATGVPASRVALAYDEPAAGPRPAVHAFVERPPTLGVRLSDSAPAALDAAISRDRGPVPGEAPVLAREIDPPTGEAIHAQIVRSIRMQWTGGLGEARVTLRPEYLGDVVASITVDRGLVTATLHADTPEVRRWIESHAASLRDALSEHGLQLDRLAVVEPERDTAPGDRQGRSRGRAPQPPTSRPRKRHDDAGATFDLTTE